MSGLVERGYLASRDIAGWVYGLVQADIERRATNGLHPPAAHQAALTCLRELAQEHRVGEKPAPQVPPAPRSSLPLSTRQVADRWNCSDLQARRWLRAARVAPVMQVGRSYFWDPDDVRAVVIEHKAAR